MEFDDIKGLKGKTSLPFPIRQCAKRWGKIIVNHKIAIPVLEVSSSIKKDIDISLVDDKSNEVGFLCFTKRLGELALNQLTENQFIAYLNESSSNDIIYKFEKDYVIINEEYYQTFITKAEDTSPIWGSFVTEKSASFLLPPYVTEVKEISISENIDLPSSHFKIKAINAIIERSAFERFLNLYHLLELNFDFETIKKIKALDIENNSQEIGNLLFRYKRDDIERLKDILHNGINDIDRIVLKLNEVSSFMPVAEAIFYTHGKDSNPLKEKQNFLNILNQGGFTPEICAKNGVQQQAHRNFICNLTAYWIYRIRSSIAHYKIGEYILRAEDECFVVEFCDPLLIEVIKQCFSKPSTI
jgi:hypothetical protein